MPTSTAREARARAAVSYGLRIAALCNMRSFRALGSVPALMWLAIGEARFVLLMSEFRLTIFRQLFEFACV
jgi:hypothetical protein